MSRMAIGIIAVILLSGCGTTVVGPVSYMSAQKNRRASIRRSALSSQALSMEEKAEVFKATAYSSRPGDVAVMSRVDVLDIGESDYTWKEILLNVTGVACDVALYGVAGDYISRTLEDDGSEDSGDYGNNNTVIIGDDNTVQEINNESN